MSQPSLTTAVTVHRVDLFPPPHKPVPLNCVLETHDISKPWTYTKAFNLNRIRIMMGTFNDAGWSKLYQKVYDNLELSRWIEHVENDIGIFCDDSSMPVTLFTKEPYYRSIFLSCAAKAGKELDTIEHLQRCGQAMGFNNVHDYKMALGNWQKQSIRCIRILDA